ncbi:macrophage mannose receptor 1-like [Cyclopterus lumpus]|uniref:macrophage mannose receptor 1-like n=1 Tax=Cyclopterus lumpus TaxID=8103 RepID=UPI00148690FE|nr:macrophage mannose receptor 1-like [Cyclopterus lumpus]
MLCGAATQQMVDLSVRQSNDGRTDIQLHVGGFSVSARRPRDEHRDGFLTMMMTKSGFSRPFLLLLLFLCGAAPGLGSVVVKQYSYFQAHHTWHEAQRFCSSFTSTDLATIDKKLDVGQLHLDAYRAWIGLHKVTYPGSPADWEWKDGQCLNDPNWAEEPLQSHGCASVLYNHDKYYGTNCEGYFFFFCNKNSFVPQSKTWAEAQGHCKGHNTDLAILPGGQDVTDAVIKQDFPVWIGVRREDRGGTLRWSSGFLEYGKWALGEPGNLGGDCVSISSTDKEMSTQMCSARFPVVCRWDNLVLVKENKTWEEALEHCRLLDSDRYHDLVSVQPGDDHGYMTEKVEQADTQEVWTGLRFLAGEWRWVNAAAMLYPDLPTCPPVRQRCGALSKDDWNGLLPADCAEKRNFLCYNRD